MLGLLVDLNRGSGSYLGHKLRNIPNGKTFKIKIVN